MKAAGLCINGANLLKLYVPGVSSSAILCHLLIRLCFFLQSQYLSLVVCLIFLEL